MIFLRLSAAEGDDGYVQPLAGGELWSARPWTQAARSARCEVASPPPGADGGRWRTLFDGEAIDLGRPQRVVARLDTESGAREVEHADGERYWISPGGDEIRRLVERVAPDAAFERALGAPLALALAQRGVHLLHASALELEGRVVALTAASGVGKSTLAAAAERTAELGLRRVADDILPVRLGAESEALPHFPQLKLTDAEGYPAEAPERRPLAALIVLERVAGESARPPRFERLAGAAAAVALAQATVATRLFDERLLAAHLEACAGASGSLRVARFTYPSGLDRLAAIVDALVAELR